MRILSAIGCNRYSHMRRLNGAEEDAKKISAAFLEDPGGYSQSESGLLLSPTLKEAQDFFRGLVALRRTEVICFYFAGHGAATASDYYLCLSDSRADRLSVSALSISYLLSVVSDLEVRQVHFILDACESGGAMYDLSKVLHRDSIGTRGSVNLAFLTAAAVDEYAYETSAGGAMSTELLKVITGKRRVQDSRPFLDLVEVGRAVSSTLAGAPTIDQTPLTWGLNLYGEGELIKNLHHRAGDSMPLPVRGIAPGSDAGQIITQYSDELWNLYYLCNQDPSPRQLVGTVLPVCERLTSSPDELWSFLRGLATAMKVRASESDELFAEYLVIASCAVCVLPFSGLKGAEEATRFFVTQLTDVNQHLGEEILAGLSKDKDYLVQKQSFLANLFYLPLRFSRIIGWIGLSTLLAGRVRMGSPLRGGEDLVDLLLERYAPSLLAVADEQAVDIYLFAHAAANQRWFTAGRTVMSALLDSFAAVEARIARTNLDGDGRLNYLLGRSQDASRIDLKLCQRPSDLYTALMLGADLMCLGERVDRFLISLDRRAASAMVPVSHREYAANVIEDAVTKIYITGFDFWRVSEFRQRLVDDCRAVFRSDSSLEESHVQALALIAAFLFPDRLPLFLEPWK